MTTIHNVPSSYPDAMDIKFLSKCIEVYSCITRDGVYGGPHKCYYPLKFKRTHQQNDSTEDFNTHEEEIHIHTEDCQKRNPLMLINTEIKTYLKMYEYPEEHVFFLPTLIFADTKYENKCNKNYGFLIGSIRLIQRNFGNVRPNWYIPIFTVIFNIARAFKDNNMMRYLNLTVNFKEWSHVFSENSEDTKEDIPQSTLTPYTNKDVLFKLLLVDGLLFEFLPRELILEIFDTTLFLCFPGSDYFESLERIRLKRKNEKRSRLLADRLKRREAHEVLIDAYVLNTELTNNEYVSDTFQIVLTYKNNRTELKDLEEESKYELTECILATDDEDYKTECIDNLELIENEYTTKRRNLQILYYKDINIFECKREEKYDQFTSILRTSVNKLNRNYSHLKCIKHYELLESVKYPTN